MKEAALPMPAPTDFAACQVFFATQPAAFTGAEATVHAAEPAALTPFQAVFAT